MARWWCSTASCATISKAGRRSISNTKPTNRWRTRRCAKSAPRFAPNFRFAALAIVHRLGRLEIGETSVWIAVSSPHRGAAFDACRYAIDTLKRAVPIWKKEYFVGGAVWAEGEVPSQEAISGPDESSSR